MTKYWKYLSLVVALAMLLAACGIGSVPAVNATSTQVPTQTARVEVQTQVVEVTKVVVQTVPPRATLAPVKQSTATIVPAVATAVQATLNGPSTSVPVVSDSVIMTNFGPMTPTVYTDSFSQGSWIVSATDRLPENPIVADWIKRLKDVNPLVWKTFPNIPNPDVKDFLVKNVSEVPDGLEYGTYATPFCWSYPCDIIVGGREYRYFAGNYEFLNEKCVSDGTFACMGVVFNVGAESVTFRGQYVDNGFTLRGLYFNGDKLEWAVWGLVSHMSANLLNLPTFSHPGEVLNAGGDSANSGSNCGHQTDACESVHVTLWVLAGNAVIARLQTVVVQP